MRRPLPSNTDAKNEERLHCGYCPLISYQLIGRPHPFRTRSRPVARYRAGLPAVTYRRTLMLNVPTFPLASNARRLIVCSPGPRAVRSTEYLSRLLSAIPSSGNNGNHGAPLMLTSAFLILPIISSTSKTERPALPPRWRRLHVRPEGCCQFPLAHLAVLRSVPGRADCPARQRR